MIQQQVRKALKDSCFEGGVNSSSVRRITLVKFQSGANKNKYSLVNKGNKPEPVPKCFVCVCVCVCVCARACVSAPISSLFPHFHSLTTANKSHVF